jgi:disulfide bond formation protein DsbB
MSVREFARFTALLAIIAAVGAVVIVVLRARLAAIFTPRMALFGAWVVATSATVGSLIFSEGYGLEPCRLCWYQRIGMYPLVLLLLVGIATADRLAWRYVVPLASAGSVVAIYHLVVQWTPADTGACEAGVPCSLRYVEEFGFVTIPFMALAGFLAIMAFTWLAATAESNGVDES